MLLMPNKKKVSSLIVAGMKKPDFVQKLGDPSGTGDFEAPPADDADMGPKASMQKLMDSIKSGDVSGALQAFRDLSDQLEGGDSDAGEPGEGD